MEKIYSNIYSDLLTQRSQMSLTQLLSEAFMHLIISYLAYYVLYPKKKFILYLVLGIIIIYLYWTEYISHEEKGAIVTLSIALYMIDLIHYIKNPNILKFYPIDKFMMYIISFYYALLLFKKI